MSPFRHSTSVTGNTSTAAIALSTALLAAFAGVLFGILRGASGGLARGIAEGVVFFVGFGLLVFARRVRQRNRARDATASLG